MSKIRFSYLSRLALASAATVFSVSVFAGSAININSASAAALAESLDGVGRVKAEAIVEDRQINGRFEHPSDITRVSGIGESTYQMNEEFILVDDTNSSVQ